MTAVNKVYVRKEAWSDSLSLYLALESFKNTIFVAKPLELQEHEFGAVSQPTLTVDPTTAQKLMDELYAVGVRPSMEKERSYQDIRNHLEDMRSLVFKK